MRIIDIIEKKQRGLELSREEIEFFVEGYTKGLIPDYQVSALLMAIYFKGMTKKETSMLALAMRDSGDVIDLKDIKGIKVDKHSTGGVGDKTSFVVGPICAALGLKFAKMSGRGLGHTGGTIDKLESIKGYKTTLSMQDFIDQVNDIGIALIGQSGNIAPADKKIYALRDVTATVSSIPLIASSIMSKKLASGADIICLDVKVGSGAFMKTIDEARVLAKEMVDIGKAAGKKMIAILTNMDEPLGYSVGNSLEVIEAIETLKGRGPKDLYELSYEIVSEMLIESGLYTSKELAIKDIKKVIENGEALDKLRCMITSQGGDTSYIDDYTLFGSAKNIINIYAKEDGYISRIDALKIGHAAMMLGAGREKLGDSIDFSAGVVLKKKVGDYTKQGDVLALAYTNKENYMEAEIMLNEAFSYTNEEKNVRVILEIVK